MEEETLSYEEKLAIAEQAFQVMHHPELQDQLRSFLSSLPQVWPEYLWDAPSHALFDQEFSRLMQNMVMMGICSGKGYPPSALNLTPEELERYQVESLAYRKARNLEIIKNSLPLNLEGLSDASPS